MKIHPRNLFTQVASCVPKGSAYKALEKSGEEEHRFTLDERGHAIHVTVWVSANNGKEMVKVETINDSVEAVSEWELARKYASLAWVIKGDKFVIRSDEEATIIDPSVFSRGTCNLDLGGVRDINLASGHTLDDDQLGFVESFAASLFKAHAYLSTSAGHSKYLYLFSDS